MNFSFHLCKVPLPLNSNVIHYRYQGNQFLFDGIRSPPICKLQGAVILHIQYQFDTMHGVSLSLHIQYQFDTIHGVSRNRIDDTEVLTVSIQEGIQSGLIVSNFILLTLDDITVALIYNPTYGKYSLFDS